MISFDYFNSEIFRMNMGNIIYKDSGFVRDDVTKVLKQAISEGYNHLSIKIPTADVSSVNSFLKDGFILVDTLVRYILDLKSYSPYQSNRSFDVRDYTLGDIESIKTIAHDSFKYDRFHSDPALDDELCDQYYERWAENSCAGFADRVLVAKDNNTVVGFATLKKHKDEGSGLVVLNAVSDKYRGQGVYNTIIQNVLQYYYDCPSIDRVIIGTQINVLPVQKTWIKNGFTVLDSYYVLHKLL